MNVDFSDRLRVVTLGGGTGSSVLLRGLKGYADRLDITGIVTTFDDGGSSGRLREEFGVAALGDLRRCIGSLLPLEDSGSAVEEMLEHRFASKGGLDGHALGNLMLLAMWQRIGSLTGAVDAMCESLDLLGRVIPISDEPATLCARLEDGTVIRGESALGYRNAELFGGSRVFLDPPVSANGAALVALRSADVVVLGPGDLFTSVIPNLLPFGVVEALEDSCAKVLQVCNVARKYGETGRYAASEFALTVNGYLNAEGSVDVIIVNQCDERATTFANAIEVDAGVFSEVDTVMVRAVSDVEDTLVHDSARLAAAVVECIDSTIGYRRSGVE